jgi:hypothetical protein
MRILSAFISKTFHCRFIVILSRISRSKSRDGSVPARVILARRRASSSLARCGREVELYTWTIKIRNNLLAR